MVVRSMGALYGMPMQDYIKEQISNEFRKKNGDRASDPAADMEQPSVGKQVGAKKNPRFVNPVHIDIFSTRKRQTDHRAISEKAVVDALVKSGVLEDDTKKHVIGIVVAEPIVSEDEKTVIVITEESK